MTRTDQSETSSSIFRICKLLSTVYCETCIIFNHVHLQDVPWHWDDSQDQSFNALKQAFTSALILQLPQDTAPYCLKTDFSDFATNAVLEQLGENKFWHLIAYYLKSLNKHEQNYEIYDKELLAIIRALEKYWHYLKEHPEPIEIWFNHLNLTYFCQAQRLSWQQACWALFLTHFNFILCHQPGKTMLHADPLSRRPDHEREGWTATILNRCYWNLNFSRSMQYDLLTHLKLMHLDLMYPRPY